VEQRAIDYRASPVVSSDELNELLAASWPGHVERDFSPVLERSLGWVCAYEGEALVGFVNVAWDGGCHAFILDTTVRPDLRRRGIGRQIVLEAVAVARERGLDWVHVDYEPCLREFYATCGFRTTTAGVIDLRPVRNQAP
jgi:GNAT superfamily N-acetyltransferase